ncbi:MAG: Mpo1-like protein [Pseudomonadota bacterium]
MSQGFASFKEFYPYYLQEHSDRVCRRLHFVGTTGVLAILAYALITTTWWMLWLLPVFGYGFAWVGHFFFEHNRPATFKHPFYSLMGDFVMYRDMWLGRVSF